eukprot:CAMPEP_0183550706 /NCGR_PEP_ID=MMETSP0371-20130417/65733_1 /TAXON_ID=268820 /ORGANISM="Peridinium aciculiferum, Strain PAER-2" /LENGTH=254 /DNA_ID=CAMNT_0025754953 /DNA_START=30 /DNA_END=794 /DNA_ORIENTATION=+
MAALTGDQLIREVAMAALTGDALQQAEDEFTDAFNQNRVVLAGFAKCESALDLACVRDGFHLGMARALRLDTYKPVEAHIVRDIAVGAAAAAGLDIFPVSVAAARRAPGWKAMVGEVMQQAALVGSDLVGIWKGLAVGRLEWLTATSTTHGLKTTLREALKMDAAAGGGGEILTGDESDAKMVWMYTMASQLPPCRDTAKAWQSAVNIADPLQPLEGYRAELWDARRTEWAPLDVAVQAAAERAGTSLDEAWVM